MNKMTARIQESKLLDLRTAAELILGGRVLVISGEESLLATLPDGNWIGGTIPYFYLKNEYGRMDKTKVFVTDFTETIIDFKISTHNEHTLKTVRSGGFENGFSFLILPAFQKIHLSFALNSHSYADLFKNPLVGLVAGTDLQESAEGRLSKVFNGKNGRCYTIEAVVLHCALPPTKGARLEIINVFEPSNEFTIEVYEDSFRISECLIDGEPRNLLDFIKHRNIDISYPLICEHESFKMSVSFQFLNEAKGEVGFYAPLFNGRKYAIAKKLENFTKLFESRVKEVLENESTVIYNCNSILNYFHSELNKNDIGFSGPATFGEIANNLLNQTFIYLAVDD